MPRCRRRSRPSWPRRSRRTTARATRARSTSSLKKTGLTTKFQKLNAGQAALLDGQAALHEALTRGFSRVEASVEAVAVYARANARLLGQLALGELDCPLLFIAVPDKPKGGWGKKAMSPSSWFNKSVTIFLVCAHGLHIVKCGPKGKGYHVKLQKDWVKKWAPIFAISLFVLKAGLAAGRVVGVPFPHVP
jgi:hypothetical protein